MAIITIGMFASFFMIYFLLPKDISVIDAAFIAGKMGKLNAIDFSFNLNDRYTFWSGLIGGTFLMLSYFGTDQSQVARYLAAKNITQSRMGLLVNGLVKIPMQFIILFIGAMVFVFFQFVTPPLFFNPVETDKIKSSIYAGEYSKLENEFKLLQDQKRIKLREMLDESSQPKVGPPLAESLSESKDANSELNKISSREQELKTSAKEIIKKNNSDADINDTNYIFITYIVNYLPIGLIGLLLAAILAASMSSTSAELNSLASTSLIDIYKRMINKKGSDDHYLKFTKYATVGWGIYAVAFALLASELGSLIEAVNILGSLFYGTILGIFLVAFYTKKIIGDSVFISAIIAEAVVIFSFFFTSIPFLWYNVIGCVIVVVLSFIFNPLLPLKEKR
jgi:Na+/proline symporter